MAIPRLICIKSKGAGMVQVYELINGTTLSQIGNDVTSSFETPATTTCRPTNRAAVFNGLELIYHRDTIRERNTGGADTWGIVATLPTANSGAGFGYHSGLYEVQISGVPTLVGIYQTSSGHVNLSTSIDGTTWNTTASVINSSIGSTVWGPDIIYRNKIYSWTNGSSADIIEVDPVAGSGIKHDIGIGSGSLRAADFCVHDNRLFVVYASGNTSGSPFRIKEFIGGSWSTIHTFTKDVGVNGEQGGPCLFSDNTDLFVILPGEEGSTDGTSCYRMIDPGGSGQSVLEITSAGANSTNGVIPAALAPGGGSAAESDSYSSFINSETDPANPETYIIRLSGPGQLGSYEIYQFTDKDTTLTSLGAGPSSDIYLPNEKNGGGTRVTASGGDKIYAEIENHEELAGGVIQFDYTVKGSGSDVTGRIYISNDEEIPATLATITGASGGSSSANAGTIIDITPDNGATTYTATFNGVSAGFTIPGSGSFLLDLT